jgi:cell division protein FtsB
MMLFFKILRNKYVIATIFFVVLLLFFDRNDLFTQNERNAELEKLTATKMYYQRENEALKKQLSDLKNSAKAIEKQAREQFYMKRSNEDVYLVEEPKKTKN